MIYLLVLLGFVFFAGLAMTINEGLWSNTVSLLCILISGLASVAAGVPFGAFMLEKADQADANAWYFVFAGMWGVFVLTLLVLRILMDKASQVRVRFLPIVDKIGGILMGLVVAVMFTSFAALTLMNAPIYAGEWKMGDASEGQKSAFNRLAFPFYNAAVPFIKKDNVDSSFLAGMKSVD